MCVCVCVCFVYVLCDLCVLAGEFIANACVFAEM